MLSIKRVDPNEIVKWIQEEVKKARASGIIVGLSGGLDSATVAVLSRLAMDENVLGLIMPCHSTSLSEEHALLVARKFGIQTQRIDLGAVYDRLLSELPDGTPLALANLKPRLRMITLYYFANTRNFLVAGTGNKSEITVGYFTKYGDGGVDILPIGGLLKTQVRWLAKDIGISDEIIAKPPTADLWAGQTDEGELGITYDELDRVIVGIESGDTDDIDVESVAKVRKLILVSEHKRSRIPVYLVS